MDTYETRLKDTLLLQVTEPGSSNRSTKRICHGLA